MVRIILASGSPQRKTLLARITPHFQVIPSSFDEPSHPEEDPRQRSIDLAFHKAQDIQKKNPTAIVIGADTLVVSEAGELMEKPIDEADARRMLELHSDATCTVHSAVCVLDSSGKAYQDISSSRVTFKKLSKADIDWWISEGLWKDRSGSFQLEGKGEKLIIKIDGDYEGIIGLPLAMTKKLLEKAGASI